MAEKTKKPIQILRDRHGGMTPELKEYFKDQNQARKKLSDAFKGGARTIPELAKETGLESSVVTWHVMAMKRYGTVAEAGRRGDYYQYAMKGDS
jgi:predicted transcriptional regulator